MSFLLYGNVTSTLASFDGFPAPPIVEAPNGPIAAGTCPQFVGRLVDRNNAGLLLGNVSTFTITIVNTLTGEVINNVSQVDVLNTGRGILNDGGDFVITLTSDDTQMFESPGAPRVQRSLILEWSTNDTPPDIGRQQMNFMVVRLEAPISFAPPPDISPSINFILPVTGTMLDGELLIPPTIVVACTFPVGGSGSYGNSVEPATAPAVVSVKKNGNTFATFTWGTGDTEAVVSIPSTTHFNGTTDEMSWEAPSPADATLGDLGLNLAGTRG